MYCEMRNLKLWWRRPGMPTAPSATPPVPLLRLNIDPHGTPPGHARHAPAEYTPAAPLPVAFNQRRLFATPSIDSGGPRPMSIADSGIHTPSPADRSRMAATPDTPSLLAKPSVQVQQRRSRLHRL